MGTGYVLVCPSTDPSWTALFTSIKGLIVERGGLEKIFQNRYSGRAFRGRKVVSVSAGLRSLGE